MGLRAWRQLFANIYRSKYAKDAPYLAPSGDLHNTLLHIGKNFFVMIATQGAHGSKRRPCVDRKSRLQNPAASFPRPRP